MKKYIYLISPQKIRGNKFYNELDKILKTKKVKYFQLRIKKISNPNLIKISNKIKKIVKKNNVKFIINDIPAIAKKIGADGCHVGQKDLDYKSSRKILGEKKIIGITCHNSINLAKQAIANGANYLALGAFYSSKTKKTKYKATIKILKLAKKITNTPIVAIGGINQNNYKKLLLNKANFLANSGYIWNNKNLNPKDALNRLK